MNNRDTSFLFVYVRSLYMLFFTVICMFLIMFHVNYFVHASYPTTMDLKFLCWVCFLYSGSASFPSTYFHYFSQWNLLSTVYAE